MTHVSPWGAPIYHWSALSEILKQTFFSARYTTPRFVACSSALLAGKLTTLAFARATQMIDPLLFSRYREQAIRQPIFILATPRSGTTFLQRLMNGDPQFTQLTLFDTLIPSVAAHRATRALATIDRAMHSPFQRYLIPALNRTLFKGWKGIHSTALEAAEEDEGLWVLDALTPGLVLFFPFLSTMDDVRHLDALPSSYRERLARYLRDMVQRQVYAAGHDRTYLAKNAASAGRIGIYREAFPDMRVVHMVRHPYESVASALSMFSKPWHIHSPQCAGASDEMVALAEMWCDYYRILAEIEAELPPERYVRIQYTDLVADPKATIETIYDQFGLRLESEYASWLAGEAKRNGNHKTSHVYDLEQFGLSESWVYDRLGDLFERYGFAR